MYITEIFIQHNISISNILSVHLFHKVLRYNFDHAVTTEFSSVFSSNGSGVHQNKSEERRLSPKPLPDIVNT